GDGDQDGADPAASLAAVATETVGRSGDGSGDCDGDDGATEKAKDAETPLASAVLSARGAVSQSAAVLTSAADCDGDDGATEKAEAPVDVEAEEEEAEAEEAPPASAMLPMELAWPSHKTFRTKRILAKKQKQNRPIPQWIRLRTDNTIKCVLLRLF
ncbi:hypothetical protein BBJ28_00017196, partial [Nothophytophthora sp. Chile5]